MELINTIQANHFIIPSTTSNTHDKCSYEIHLQFWNWQTASLMLNVRAPNFDRIWTAPLLKWVWLLLNSISAPPMWGSGATIPREPLPRELNFSRLTGKHLATVTRTHLSNSRASGRLWFIWKVYLALLGPAPKDLSKPRPWCICIMLFMAVPPHPLYSWYARWRIESQLQVSNQEKWRRLKLWNFGYKGVTC